jgi:hypothetical protein
MRVVTPTHISLLPDDVSRICNPSIAHRDVQLLLLLSCCPFLPLGSSKSKLLGATTIVNTINKRKCSKCDGHTFVDMIFVISLQALLLNFKLWVCLSCTSSRYQTPDPLFIIHNKQVGTSTQSPIILENSGKSIEILIRALPSGEMIWWIMKMML